MISRYYRPELNKLAVAITAWREEKGFKAPTEENVPEKLMLVVSELGEALEADRRGDRSNFEEELADAIIRLLDMCESMEVDIALAVAAKMEVNEKRPTRHGKRY